jgi:hypothetical protein
MSFPLTSDNQPLVQKLIDGFQSPARDAGGTIHLPAGDVTVSAGLVVDYDGQSQYPNAQQTRVRFQGQGSATDLQSVASGVTSLTIQGSRPLNAGSYQLGNVASHMNFSGPNDRSVTGLKLQDLAFWSVSDVSFQNLYCGLDLEGALSGSVNNALIMECTYGALLRGGASHCNKIVWSGGEFGRITKWGLVAEDGMSSGVFQCYGVEGCGTVGDMDSGGIKIAASGSQGSVLPSFRDCYFEGNTGFADIFVESTAGKTLKLNASACIFTRTDAKYTQHNIVTIGPVDILLSGNTFEGRNGYTADASRPYILRLPDAEGRIGRIIDQGGNTFESPEEAPRIDLGPSYHGKGIGSVGGIAPGDTIPCNLPAGWAATWRSGGVARITHNLDTLEYDAVATTFGADDRRVERIQPHNPNYFEVVIGKANGDNTDYDFSFSLQQYGGSM